MLSRISNWLYGDIADVGRNAAVKRMLAPRPQRHPVLALLCAVLGVE